MEHKNRNRNTTKLDKIKHPERKERQKDTTATKQHLTRSAFERIQYFDTYCLPAAESLGVRRCTGGLRVIFHPETSISPVVMWSETDE